MPQGQSPTTMLDIDVAGMARVGEDGIEIERAPDGVTFEPLADHELLGTLVGADDKFTAHNAASWQHGLLVHVPKGVVLEQPLYVRIANSSAGGSLFWRLLVIAEEGSRFTLIEEYASSVSRPRAATRTRPSSSSSSRARSSSTSRSRISRARRGTSPRTTRRVGRDAELDWVAGGFGSKKGKTRIQNDLAGQGATSRVTGAYFADGTQHLDYDTFQEHIAPHTTSDFAFKGALRDHATTVWRGMIRVEHGGAEDERLPGEPQPPALEGRARRLDPRARDPGQRRPLHARRDARPGRPRPALLPDGPRPLALGGRAADRPRLLPGRARPHRARAGPRGARGRARSTASRPRG